MSVAVHIYLATLTFTVLNVNRSLHVLTLSGNDLLASCSAAAAAAGGIQSTVPCLELYG